MENGRLLLLVFPLLLLLLLANTEDDFAEILGRFGSDDSQGDPNEECSYPL